MNLSVFALFGFVLAISCNISRGTVYKPTWESLDSRPLPKWYDEAKIGIFIHWGVFSVPSICSEWFWHRWKVDNETSCVEFVENNYRKDWTYQDFAKDFGAIFYNPEEWAEIFEKSGAKYVVITTKHHEGYAMWPSKYSFSWNAMDVGPHRDLIGDLAIAVRKKKLIFGLYHSLFEWFNPLYLEDLERNFTTSRFVDNKVYPEMVELVDKYRPQVFWSDGDASAPAEYWRSKEFLAWLYNNSTVKDSVVVNDRWGKDTECNHGGYYSCHDRYNPGVVQQHKWENAMTLDKHSWGFRRNARLEDYLTIQELLRILAETVSCGGNLFINVGPTKDGMIDPIFEDRLTDLGTWLKVNGEAIYESKPWKVQNDTLAEVWYTSKAFAIYGIMLHWPDDGILELGSASELFNQSDVRVILLGYNKKLKWTRNNTTVSIKLPDYTTMLEYNCWVVKITNY